MTIRRVVAAAAVAFAVIALALTIGRARDTTTVFRGIAGPEGRSIVPREIAATAAEYDRGTSSRLAVLLSDPDSPWLGLAHGLKSFGIPFRITTDYREALRHRVVLVYPIISGRVLPPDALAALSAFPRRGGTLIGVNVLGGGLDEVFGFRDAVASRARFEIRFTAAASGLLPIMVPQEAVIRLGDRAKSQEAIGTYGYTAPQRPPVAVYEDGTAAITQQNIGQGRAYAIGLDLGDFMLRGYNNREEWIARSYVNGYEPAIDMLLRLLREVYVRGEPKAVTLGTVPYNRRVPVLLTHDLDYSKSMENAITYAQYERSQGVRATYFVETKYIRDYNDIAFFNDRGVALMKTLDRWGMELGSHTVAHSRIFRTFPLGTGLEQFPAYRPFVKDLRTTNNGSILGELRVSKFLLERLIGHQTVVSFRAGDLSNPYALPQSLVATGYRFSSSVTANDSLTHLPFQLTYGRSVRAETPIFEFPITIEDQAPPLLGARLSLAIDLVHRLSAYGGSVVILIHPNILGHKLAFEEGFVAAVKGAAWFGSVSDFGDWWAARNQVEVDVSRTGTKVVVQLHAPQRIDGLTLRVPATWAIRSTTPQTVVVATGQGAVVLGPLQDQITLVFQSSSPLP
jgi:hypothetical protein